jgi:molybdopterin synthase catalytic subunit
MKEGKIKNIFVKGAILPNFIAEVIAKHSTKKDIGAHSIFLGQVRNDVINDKEVRAIDYSSYAEMADEIFHEIREAAFEKYSLTCMHLFHSLGFVKAGAISLFVFASSRHRKDAMDACSYIVNRIKEEVPVWGKEVFEDESYQWKKQLK